MRAYIHTYTDIRTYIHIYIHTYIHSYIHAWMYTVEQVLPQIEETVYQKKTATQILAIQGERKNKAT